MRTSSIGGDAAHRGLFGRSSVRSRTMMVIVPIALVVGAVGGTTGLWVAAGLVVVGLVLTASTPRGTLVERVVRWWRWRSKVRSGLTRFVPFDEETWEELVGRGWRARQEAAALREWPDGCEGLGWLQAEKGKPGIAWQTPVGEEPYLSVCWAVGGQHRGVESDESVEVAAASVSQFLESFAPELRAPQVAQILTRVLPPDSALHESWILDRMDPSAPDVVLRSYDSALRMLSKGALIQRHFVVMRWPLSSAFKAEAARYGLRQRGWREFMAMEIETMQGVLAPAFGGARPLSARQTVAVTRHMQDPGRPIDQVSDVNLLEVGEEAREEYGAYVVTGTDALTREPAEWWHTTGMITSEGLSSEERTSLWLLPILTGMPDQIIRTISFQILTRPAEGARVRARRAVTQDSANINAAREKGRLVDDGDAVTLTAAQRRRADLRPGQPHHGAEWVGYVTLSARSREELRRAVRVVRDRFGTALGAQIEWLDTYQAAAMGCTWPLARGIRTSGQDASERLATMLTGKSAKESLA